MLDLVCAGGESGQVGGTDQGSPECWSGVFCGRSCITVQCPLIPAGIFNLNYLNSVSIDHKFNVDRGQELKQQLLFWLTMVKVSLDYQESRSQQIGFLHGLGSATRMLLGGQ